MLAPARFQNCCSTWPTARPRGVAVNEHLEIDGLAVVLDQRLGLLDVFGQRTIVLAFDPGAVAVGIAGRSCQTIGNRLRHLLAVERHHQRLAHAHVVERRDLGVEGVDLRAGAGIGVHGQLRILLRLLNVVGVVFVVPDDIGLAGLQAGKARLRVRQRLQDDAVEIGPALVPVVRILLEHHAVARGPGLQDIGTGADGIAVVVVALGLPRRRRLHRHLFALGKLTIAGKFTDGSFRL